MCIAPAIRASAGWSRSSSSRRISTASRAPRPGWIAKRAWRRRSTTPPSSRVFDVGHHEGQPYVVMELIEGRTLAARISDGRLPIREAVEIAMQVADGLAAAHDAGVVHRDLKPQNIMLTAEGRPKVVDFGLSKVASSPESGNSETIAGETLTDRYAVLGTAGYMAPEQVLSLPVDARTDQFALGAILYEMLTGRRAFRRDSPVQTMSAILEDEPAPMAAARPDLPADVVSIVARCLAKRPERRYAATRDLAHDLRDAYEQILLDTRSGSRVRRVPAPAWRWPAAIVAATLAVLVLAVVAWQRGPWRGRRYGFPALGIAPHRRAAVDQRHQGRRRSGVRRRPGRNPHQRPDAARAILARVARGAGQRNQDRPHRKRARRPAGVRRHARHQRVDSTAAVGHAGDAEPGRCRQARPARRPDDRHHRWPRRDDPGHRGRRRHRAPRARARSRGGGGDDGRGHLGAGRV